MSNNLEWLVRYKEEQKRGARKRKRVWKERFDMLTDQYMKLTKREAVEQLADNVCDILEQQQSDADWNDAEMANMKLRLEQATREADMLRTVAVGHYESLLRAMAQAPNPNHMLAGPVRIGRYVHELQTCLVEENNNG
tara:strand:+ start:874 stop:1287 length:414 start_codon:yes stop_codon:yes gene_type:complete